MNFSNTPKKFKRDKITFEVHLAEHCNLNCCGCDHFSPLAEPELTDIEEFTKDISRMGDIFSHECREIHLLGGEPLLHPEINTFMKITRDKFSKGRILIVTNGLLLLSKADDFWQSCHDNNITVAVTRYPIKLDIDAIRKKAEAFDVEFEYYIGLENKISFRKEPLDLTGSQNPERSFAFCERGNNCNFLRHGRLYNCTFTGNVHHFNKKFGTNIAITDYDYIDIYSDIDKDTILERLCKPVPACRYCEIQGIKAGIQWHVSRCEISEWV